ncbi:MAG TPA: hypothetical protein VI408_13100 [Gaiellaceae bacterium]
MGLFRRRKPLHRQLADDAGLALDPAATRGPAAAPPGWDGEQRGEPGIHGVPRARRWDVVLVAQSDALRGASVHFVTLPDGTVVVDEDEPDGSVAPLADAVEERLAPPYRAEAVRQDGSTWSVAARRIDVAEEPSLDGEEAELVVSGGERTLTVDGERRVAIPLAFERGGDAVYRARRLDGTLWEVEATPL